jgi:hypothetical protein
VAHKPILSNPVVEPRHASPGDGWSNKNLSTHTDIYPEPYESLYRIQRGLAGNVSFLAACESNVVFSEYLLYQSICQILAARKYRVSCEAKCPGYRKHGRGDHKRLDFVASKEGVSFALEVKWHEWPDDHTPRRLNAKEDMNKLAKYHRHHKEAFSFLCVFGRKKHITNVGLPSKTYREPLLAIFAEFLRTRYGCRIFELCY